MSNTNLRMNISVHNKFEFTLLDEEGRVKQKAYAYNIVLNNFWAAINASYGLGSHSMFSHIGIGTGTGTPAATDTSLFTELTKVQIGDNRVITKAYPMSTGVFTATFIATPTYVGTITEVGLFYGSKYGSSAWDFIMVTHAMLQDAEGNSITIVKTDLDQLIVTATVYTTMTFPSNFIPVDPTSNAFLRIYDNFIKQRFRPDTMGLSIETPQIRSITNNNSITVDTTARTITWATKRLESASSYNGVFCNAVYFADLGLLPFPISDFPAYTLANTEIGRGDGVTKLFDCPIPVFIPDTDVVKVAGITQTRGTDYTIDPNGNNKLVLSAAACARAVSKTGHNANPSYVSNIFTHRSDSTVWLYSVSGVITFDMGESIECNTLHLTNVIRTSTNFTGHFRLEHSSNGTSWTTVVETAEQTFTTTSTPVTGGPLFYFTTVSARYWRFSLVTAEPSTNKGVGFVNAMTLAPLFGYTGPKITFAEAPAVDALITIAAQVDRPWKTTDYIVDYAATVSY